MQKRHRVPSSCRLDEAVLKIKDPALLCRMECGSVLGTDSRESIWNQSRILNETKVRHSKFRCTINAFKSKCICSHGVSEISFTVLAFIKPNLKPTEGSGKNPTDINRPIAWLTSAVPALLWSPVWEMAPHAYMAESAIVNTCNSILCFSLSGGKDSLELAQQLAEWDSKINSRAKSGNPKEISIFWIAGLLV